MARGRGIETDTDKTRYCEDVSDDGQGHAHCESGVHSRMVESETVILSLIANNGNITLFSRFIIIFRLISSVVIVIALQI